MDIVSGSITIIEGTFKLLEALQNIKQYQHNISALSNEAADLASILYTLQVTNRLPVNDEDMRTRLQEAQLSIGDLQTSLAKRQYLIWWKRPFIQGQLHAHQNHLRALKKHIHSISNKAIVARQAETFVRVCAAQETLEDLKNMLQDLQTTIQARQQQSRSEVSNPDSSLISQSINGSQASQIRDAADIVIETAPFPQSACQELCSCCCHNFYHSQSPAWLQRILGEIFIGYKAIPLLVPPCNANYCRRRSETQIRFRYSFPQWFVAQRICAVTWDSFPFPDVRISLMNRISPNADIFHFTSRGDINTLKKLFQAKKASPLDINSIDGRSALHTAVNMGQWEVCQWLINCEANQHLRDNAGISPASSAWEKWLSLGPEQRDRIRKIFSSSDQDDNEYLAELKLTRLMRVIVGYSTNMLLDELRDSISLQTINQQDAQGNTALMWAAKRGEGEAIKILLDHHADPNVYDKANRSPLHYIGRTGDAQLVTRLLRSGANTGTLSQWGSTVLHFACVQGGDNVEFVDSLVNAGLHINARNKDLRTALSEAARYDNVLVADFLIKRGADIDCVSTKGETPLMEGISLGSCRTVDLLLRHGASYTGVASGRNTILHLAAIGGHIKVLEALRKHTLAGIDLDAANIDGFTAEALAEVHNDENPHFVAKFRGLLLQLRVLNRQATTGILTAREDADTGQESEDVFLDASESLSAST